MSPITQRTIAIGIQCLPNHAKTDPPFSLVKADHNAAAIPWIQPSISRNMELAKLPISFSLRLFFCRFDIDSDRNGGTIHHLRVVCRFIHLDLGCNVFLRPVYIDSVTVKVQCFHLVQDV